MTPWSYIQVFLDVRIQRARNAPSRGASAVEWVIITAVIAGVAMALALLIKSLVGQEMGNLEKAFNTQR
ncbi:hypothetical protein AB0J35_58705 [Nonomuraea angiospora]|uniref:hypothetical protein n=1 Tax=Nonomuraea angiospora TaxID=46172 RepID=UPI0029A6F9D6|nr:hypothetical protein [Nonomuraea angiospora]MDX3099960.1 hypothetical protein [Nonomuraea angiospora]